MNPWLWVILVCVIAVLAVVEFTLLARRPRVVSASEALAGTFIWVMAAALFGRVIYYVYENNWLGIQALLNDPSAPVRVNGATALTQFVTVYVTEMALSLDNIAALTLLLVYYNVPRTLVARVLYWAVTVALVVRLAVIGAVGPFASSVDWLHYVFAGLLIVAVVRILLLPDASEQAGRRRWRGGGVLPRLVARFVHVADEQHGSGLTTKVKDEAGRTRRALTPLAAVVLVVAIADLTYAADFLPAAYTITREPFIAFAGNAFALLTLRSLYFSIAPFMRRFRFLKLSLVFILLWVAVNTLFFFEARRPAEVMLGVVCGILACGVVASVLVERRRPGAVDPHLEHGPYDFRPAPIDDIKEAAAATRRNFRKVCILIAGTAVIIFGIIIAPLPGPGPTVLVPIGIAILATEFIWARRLLDRLKEEGDKLASKTDQWSAKVPKWAVVLLLVVWPLVWGGLWWWLHSHDRKVLATLAMATGFGLAFPIVLWAWRRLRGVKKSSAAETKTS
ncbi:MAG: PGPGW domain-containing protein [Phycisphaerales bacterium]